MTDPKEPTTPLTRRQLVQRGTAAAAALLLTACMGERADEAATPTRAIAQREATATSVPATAEPAATGLPAATATEQPAAAATEAPAPTAAPLTPTPACDDDDDDPTLAQTEGPFYTPDTPERSSFREDGPGTPMVVTGRVLTTDCMPVAGAVVDFWHANDSGEYDNAGYLFRGHQFTDATGSYRLETVVPGLYTGRTRHFHVKVQGPTTALLTTQLYFPGEPDNARDGIYNPALEMMMTDGGEGSTGTFDFVLV